MSEQQPIIFTPITPEQIRAIIREELARAQAQAPEPTPERWLTIAQLATETGYSREYLRRKCAEWRATKVQWVSGGDGKAWRIEINGYREYKKTKG